MNWITTCGVLLMAFGQADVTSVPQSSELEAAAEQLSARRYGERQQATELLWSAGEEALPVLARAARSKNREVRERVAFLQENIRQGIAFNAPRAVLREVLRFRHGDELEKRQAVATLEAHRAARVLLGIVRDEPDVALREDWRQSLERTLQACVLHGETELLEDTLRRASEDPEWSRHWVAYLAARGELPVERERLLTAESAGKETSRARLLAQFARAEGDLARARQFAEEGKQRNLAAEQFRDAGPPASASPSDRLDPANPSAGEEIDWAWELTLEARDWRVAARELHERITKDPEGAGADPESLGFAAAYHRLAGDEAGFAVYKQRLIDLATEAHGALPELDPRRQDAEKEIIDQHWYVGKALLLNGCRDEAMEVLRRHHPAFAFEFLTYQQKYREAFAIADVSYPHGFDTAWFKKVATETTMSKHADRQRLALALHAVRQLTFLGQRPQATEWLEILAAGAARDSGTIASRMVADTAVKLGWRGVAVRVGATVLHREGSPQALAILYPNRQTMAQLWWDYFQDAYDRESGEVTLARVDQCLRMTPVTEVRFDEWLPDLEDRLRRLVEPKRSESWGALAETCLLHGQRDRALIYFERAALYSAPDSLRLGDLFAEGGEWKRAAEQYQRAFGFDRTNALALYLCGAAQTKGGDPAGAALCETAKILPLAHDATRRRLAAGLKERGYRDASLEQFELLVRTGAPGEDDVVEAKKQIGNAVHEQDPFRGADGWEAMILCCLRSKWGFADATGYVQIPFLVHKTRTKGLLKEQQWEAAAKELWASVAAAPSHLELADELLPQLRKGQRNEDAERLFDTCFATLQQHCVDFPKCATWHNNLAWLCATNERALDTALEHSQRALELEPDNAAFIDTLGEIRFRQGRIDEALACADRCLKLNPGNKHYQEQRARFHSAKEGGN